MAGAACMMGRNIIMTPDGQLTSSTERSLAFSQAVKGIASIIGLMTMVFTLLEAALPSSFVQPVAALLCGVALTIFLVWWYRWHLATLLTTSLAFGLLLIILHLIVTRPATVAGAIMDGSQQPQPGVSLALTDASGVAHNAISDANGAFVVSNMPEGPFTLTANGELLFMGQVCSGWRRILTSQQEIGAFAYGDGSRTAPIVEPVVTVPAGTPAAPTIKIVDIDYAPATSPLDEVVILRNEGNAPQDMTGWRLEDIQGHTYVFPPFVLEADARVRVWTKEGQDTSADLFWGIRTTVWNDDVADTAALKNNQGEVIDAFTYTP